MADQFDEKARALCESAYGFGYLTKSAHPRVEEMIAAAMRDADRDGYERGFADAAAVESVLCKDERLKEAHAAGVAEERARVVALLNLRAADYDKSGGECACTALALRGAAWKIERAEHVPAAGKGERDGSE